MGSSKSMHPDSAASGPAAKEGTARAGRPSRRKRPGRLSLARRGAGDLRELVQNLLRDPAVCTDGPPQDGELELCLPLDLLLAPGDEGRPGPRDLLAKLLVRQLGAGLNAASRSGPPLVAGQAWCLLCREPGCAHSLPPKRDHVFAGYSATGTPRWETFAARCLEIEPQRADRLYGPHAELLALVHSGEELRRDLLPGFGGASEGFRLLAQLDMGLLSLGGERVAASFQALRVHPADALPRIVLHWIGLESGDLDAEPGELGGLDPFALRDLLRGTKLRLQGLLPRQSGSDRSGEPSPSLEELAQCALNRLKGGIERMWRQRRRRTRHAGERKRQEGRPVEEALRDARRAGEEEILIDKRQATVVVLGPRGRAHVFTQQALHVTSLKIDRAAVRRRVQRGRWCAAGPQEITSFRAALDGRLDGQPESRK